jgi:hypothetical protein
VEHSGAPDAWGLATEVSLRILYVTFKRILTESNGRGITKGVRSPAGQSETYEHVFTILEQTHFALHHDDPKPRSLRIFRTFLPSCIRVRYSGDPTLQMLALWLVDSKSSDPGFVTGFRAVRLFLPGLARCSLCWLTLVYDGIQ